MKAPESPFKGLASFDESDLDALLFFGREREREIIAANLMASRLTVLYGETGVGKSSVLRAGVVRDLRTLPDPLAVVVFDDWQDDPAAALRNRLAESVGAPPAASLAETLELCSVLVGGEVFVVLDGLEAYFLYHGSDTADPFLEDFAQAVAWPGLRTSFLLSIREDALAKLDRFKSRIPNVLGNYLRLDHLDRAAGREAIVGPVDRYNELAGDGRIEIEPALVDAVLDQVAAGKVEVGRSGRGGVEDEATAGRIEAPFLQLVMARLWDAEQAAGSSTLRLETLVALGGAEQIVRDHLDRALDALGARQRDLAAAAFNHLVTPSGTKIAHDASDLAGYVGATEAELAPVLAALASQRILRPVPGVPGSDLPRYEIYHDILAPAVLAWRTRHQSARRVEQVRATAAKRHRRLLVIAVAAVLLAGAMAGVTILFFAQRSEADTQARKAHARAFEASALLQLSIDPQLGLRLAFEAAKLAPDTQAQDALRRALQAARERAVFPASDEVMVARYSPDGTRILVAGLDGIASLYDASTHARLFHVNAKTPITSGGFSPDGRTFVTGGSDGKIELWSTRNGSPLETFHNGSAVRSVAFDQSGDLLVSAGGLAVQVWRRGRATPLWRHRFAWPVKRALFSPDGTLVAAFGNDSHAYLFEADSGLQRYVLNQGDWIECMAFSPHGAYFVTGGRNDTARIWNLRTGAYRELAKHSQDVVDVAFTPNGLKLASASTDGTARTWDVESGQPITDFSGHSNSVTSVSFSRDARYLLTGSSDGTARIWENTDTPDVVDVLAGHSDAVTEASFSPDGKSVLTGSADGTARLWDAVQPTLDIRAVFHGKLAGAAYAGQLLAVAGPGAVVHLLHADGRPEATLPFPDAVTAVKVAPNGKLLAVAVGNNVYLVRLRDRRRVGSIHQRSVVTALAFSPDSAHLVTGGTDHVARIWTLLHSGVVRLRGHRKPLTGVAFSPDGKLVGTASKDGTARTWDALTGRLLRTFAPRHEVKPLTSVSFSPEGSLLLTAGSDRDARLWSVASGALVRTLRWHFGTVVDAGFSPDGRWIVTAGPLTAQLWDPDIPQPLFQFGIGGPAKPLASAVFDPTSRVVLAASQDGTVRAYRCTLCGGLDDLRRIARQRLAIDPRPLTAAERKRYGG